MSPGEQSGDSRENGKNRSTQGHPRNPRFAAVFGGVMDLFVQMLERNFGFFHRRSLGLRIVLVQ
jgi:hypothetical protein